MIDLRSDTVTRPTAAMRDAARDATIGDDVYGDDPTVADLERRAAERVGMPAALFVPWGTVGNQIAAPIHADRGQDVLLDDGPTSTCENWAGWPSFRASSRGPSTPASARWPTPADRPTRSLPQYERETATRVKFC